MKFKTLVFLGLSVVSSLSTVQAEVPVTKVELTKMEAAQKFKDISGWTAKVQIIEQSPIDSFYQIVADGRVFYVSKDGEHLISGDLFSFDRSFKNYTEPRARTARYSLTETEGKGFVEYKAAEEKHIVYVFTDPTCGYCKKFHERMDGYLAKGITVRYIPWPRGDEKNMRTGLTNPVFTNLSGAMCSSDKKSAINALYNGGGNAMSDGACDNDMRRYLQLGKKLGVKGTPAILTDKGMLLRGYREPYDLAKLLNGENTPSASSAKQAD